MSRLVEHVEHEIAARGLLRRGQALLVAVSGGCDSMVLLHVLHKLEERHRWKLTVAHFNHQLRGRSSDADERLVRRTARKLKIPFFYERANVRRFAKTEKISIEMAARKLRHDFLARCAIKRRIPSVALAHHADDQLELFFLRLLRGSGGEGLGGMKWRNASPSDNRVELVRPLLGENKSALSSFARENGIEFREDATNRELDFQRNQIRHKLLPLLKRDYPGIDKTVLRSAELIGAEAEFVMETARQWLQRKLQVPSSKLRKNFEVQTSNFKKEKVTELGRLRFDDLPVAVARRCVQLQLINLGVNGDFGLIEKLRLHPEEPISIQPLSELSRVAVREVEGRVAISEAKPAQFRTEMKKLALQKAGEVRFGDLAIDWRNLAQRGLANLQKRKHEEKFDADKVGSPVVLRYWQPGDRFQPIGMKRSIKLQDFFTNEKVPRGNRHDLVVATTKKGELFWVEGMRISERFKLTNETKRRLKWRWRKANTRNSHIAAMG